MALEVGTTSYISVADAAGYFADRLDADAWHDVTEDRQSAALITATKQIDRQPLMGKRSTSDQHLQFPRCTMTAEGWLCDDAVPDIVKDATCEQAFFLLALNDYERDRLRQHTLGVIGNSLGNANEYSNSMMVRQNRARTILCPEAKELLRGWLAGSVRIR